MATNNNLNPFYIEPNNEESGWQYDTDDLDELLEHDSAPTTYHSPRGSSRRGGRLPVPNLAYDDDISNIRHRRRLRLVLLSVVALVIAWTVVSQKTKSTNVVDKPGGGAAGRFNDDDDDEQDDDRPSQTHQQPPVSKVRAIVTLGERNSGLSWLTAKLQQCYPSLSVKSGFSREGMWFQDNDADETNSNDAATLIVSVFDNPYDWVEQMRLHPEFSPSHASITSWDSFVTKPWTLDNYQKNATTTKTQCQLGFASDRVIPCNAEDFPKPAVYELNPSDGSVFASIVDLRATKIRHFVQEVTKFQHVLAVVPVQYERLVGDALDPQHKHSGYPGLLNTLNEIKEISGGGLEFECDVVADKSLFAKPVGNHKKLKQPYVEWMNAHVDWDAEALVGYSKWDTIPPSQVGWSESNPDGLAEDDDGFAEDDDDDTREDGGGRDITDTKSPTATPSAVPTNIEPESTDSPTASPSSAEHESTGPPTASPSSATDTNGESGGNNLPTVSPSAAGDGTAEHPSAAPTDSTSTEAPTAVQKDTETPTSSPSSIEPAAADTLSTTAPTANSRADPDSNLTTAPPTDSPSSATTTNAPTNHENNVRRRR